VDGLTGGTIPMPHNFRDSLASSHAAEGLSLWAEVYQKAFPSMVSMVNHRQDGEHQRSGIDRSIILANSKQILVDEKIRWKAYNDIAIEFLSDRDRKIQGWVCKPLRCDYIAYAVAPLGKCYLLPTLQLQSAWAENCEQWAKQYREILAHNSSGNRSYVTVSLGAPVSVLFSAIGKCLRVCFKPRIQQNPY